MINLLPYDLKKQTRAARINIILIRYIVISLFAIIFLGLACFTTYFYIPIIFSSNDVNTVNVQTKSDSNTEINKQAKIITNNLTTAKKILDSQIKYSVILEKIASALPTGTILQSLELNDSIFGSGTAINLKILANSSDIESAIKQGFQSTDIFSDYKLVSNTINDDDSTKYTNVINISVILNKVIMQ